MATLGLLAVFPSDGACSVVATCSSRRPKVKRSGREYNYLQLVEGYRDENGKVRHRVVANLGRKDALKDSGQLEALAGSFARLDPPMAGTRRSVGPLLLVEHFLRELAVMDTVDGVVAAQRPVDPVGRGGRVRAGRQSVVLALAVV